MTAILECALKTKNTNKLTLPPYFSTDQEVILKLAFNKTTTINKANEATIRFISRFLHAIFFKYIFSGVVSGSY